MAVESSMMDMLGAVLRQLRWYLLIVVLTVYCFTVAVFILFRHEHRPDEESLLDYKEEECFGNEQPWDRLEECKPWECLTNDTSKFKYCISRPYLVGLRLRARVVDCAGLVFALNPKFFHIS